jgi:excisionase family DNA binding protein
MVLMHREMVTLMDKLLLTREEAAAVLNLHTRSIDYLVAQHRLPSRKLGKRRLIPREAVETLAQKGCGRISPAPKLNDAKC